MLCYGGWRKIPGEKVREDETNDIEWLTRNFELWNNDRRIVNFCILLKVSENNIELHLIHERCFYQFLPACIDCLPAFVWKQQITHFVRICCLYSFIELLVFIYLFFVKVTYIQEKLIYKQLSKFKFVHGLVQAVHVGWIAGFTGHH